MTFEPALSGRGPHDLHAAERLIAHVRGLIEKGTLRPGDRLTTERDLVRQIGVSRASVREGLRSLAAMRVVTTRQGSGVFITAGPPALASEPLGLIMALHGISRSELFETWRVLESRAAALAAERAAGERRAAISDEILGMYTAPGAPRRSSCTTSTFTGPWRQERTTRHWARPCWRSRKRRPD